MVDLPDRQWPLRITVVTTNRLEHGARGLLAFTPPIRALRRQLHNAVTHGIAMRGWEAGVTAAPLHLKSGAPYRRLLLVQIGVLERHINDGVHRRGETRLTLCPSWLVGN